LVTFILIWIKILKYEFFIRIIIIMKNSHINFLRELILTIILWVAAWGFISTILDHYIRSFNIKLIMYALIFIISFRLLQLLEHIP